MFKNIIFDFGNVIAEFNPDKLTAPYAENKEDLRLLSDVVFDRLYWDGLDAGIISDDEAKEKIANRLPLHLKDAGLKVFDNWINNMTPVPNVREVIFKLKKEGKRLFLLSNISIGFFENYKKTPWINEVLSEFDGLILSGVTGLLKPDPEVFEYILSKYNLKREETLFIDDSPKNIKGAEAVRLRGYLFNGDGLKLERFLSGL